MAPPHVGHHASRRSPRVQYGPNEGFRRRLEPAPQRNRYLVDAAAARQGRTGAVTDGGLQHDHGHTTGAPVLTVPTKVQSGFSSRTATHGSTTTRWVTRFGGAATITASATSTPRFSPPERCLVCAFDTPGEYVLTVDQDRLTAYRLARSEDVVRLEAAGTSRRMNVTFRPKFSGIWRGRFGSGYLRPKFSGI
jgi:hypothetical protein